MQLTDEQKHVIKELSAVKKLVTTCGGYAGVGKTTIIQHLIHAMRNWAVCAFTGKAVNVLRDKGIANATTIHSLIYNVQDGPKGVPIFLLRNELECGGIIVDEASMVGEDLDQDLRSFGLPIIYIGDHGQLEPVGDRGFNLMSNPDYRLEQIHRNAGEIAHFADFIRQGYKPSAWERKSSGKMIEFIDKSEIDNRVLEVDQIICAFNKTRVRINKEVRRQLEYDEDQLSVGDRVMCLRNNKDRGLFNGMQGEVVELQKRRHMIFRSVDASYLLRYDHKQFNKVKYEIEFERGTPDPFDYCYAITCHKSQGSEFDTGLVVEEKCDLWEHARWAYTAASRFKKKIIWARY